MGQIQRMKSLLFLVLLALAKSEWTCEECEKVMKTVLESDISEEGIQQQVDILLAEVCPQLEDAETCGECIIGLEYIFATFAMPETVDWLMEYVSGPAFCESSEDPESCKQAIETVLPLAIPALAATQNSEEEIAFCKAVLGVC